MLFNKFLSLSKHNRSSDHQPSINQHIEIIEGVAARWQIGGFNRRKLEKESLKKELRGHLFPTTAATAASSSAQVASLFDSQIEAKDRAEGSHCSAMPVQCRKV